MKTQATKATPKQLAYLAYWQARGYRFGRYEAIPENTCITPSKWDRPRAIELVATLAALILLGALQYFFN